MAINFFSPRYIRVLRLAMRHTNPAGNGLHPSLVCRSLSIIIYPCYSCALSVTLHYSLNGFGSTKAFRASVLT